MENFYLPELMPEAVDLSEGLEEYDHRENDHNDR